MLILLKDYKLLTNKELISVLEKLLLLEIILENGKMKMGS